MEKHNDMQAGNRPRNGAAAAGENASAASNPIRVLLVDDSPVFLASAGETVGQCPGLELAGAATSGAEALALIAQTAPDLVLMDLNMPGMNGLEATRHAKAIAPATRVMLISVQRGEDLRRAAIAAGADAFVAKDDLGAEFLQHLRTWFGAEAAQP